MLVGSTVGGTLVAVYACAATGRAGAGLICAFAPLVVWFYVRARVERRRREFAEQLPDNLQVVASALRAGHSFESGLAVAADDAAEPMRSELKRIVADERLGIPLETAMATVSKRMKSREMEHVGLVVALQREAGGNTAEILDTLTDSLRYRAELNGLVRTLTAQGRTGGLIVSLMPFGLGLLLAVMNPNYFDPLVGNLAGQFLLAVAGVCVGLGWLFIRKIVDIKV